MKKIIILMFTAFSLFFLTSCTNKDEVAEALIQYNNEEWLPINEMKKTKLDGLHFELDELETKGKEEDAISLIKEEYIPVEDEVLDRLKDVNPNHKKVKKWNDMQIEAEEYAKKHFKQIVVYYEDGDVTEKDIDQYTEDLKKKYLDIFDYRDELMDKYNLEYAEDDEDLGHLRDLQRKED